MAGPRGGCAPRPLRLGTVCAAVGRSDRPVASDLDGRALLGLRRDRSVDRDASARPGGHPPGRDRRAARSLGAGMLRDARRPKARRARGDRAQRWERHPIDSDPSSKRWPRMGDRRAEGLHRQRRDRRRSRRRGHRRPRSRSSRPRCLHRAQGHRRPVAAAQTRQAGMSRLAHRRDRLGELSRAERAPARRKRATAGANRQRSRVRTRTQANRPGRRRWPGRGHSTPQLSRAGRV